MDKISKPSYNQNILKSECDINYEENLALWKKCQNHQINQLFTIYKHGTKTKKTRSCSVTMWSRKKIHLRWCFERFDWTWRRWYVHSWKIFWGMFGNIPFMFWFRSENRWDRWGHQHFWENLVNVLITVGFVKVELVQMASGMFDSLLGTSRLFFGGCNKNRTLVPWLKIQQKSLQANLWFCKRNRSYFWKAG